MIYDFTVENFRSFGAAQTLSLIKGKERNKPENLIEGPPGFPKAVCTAAIFGPNASGKSNLIRAAQTMRDIVKVSAIGLNAGDTLPGIAPHRLDRQWADRPTRFEITFSIGARGFRYGFSATPQAITAETLVEEFSTGRSRTLFERRERTHGDAAIVEFGDQFDSVAKNNVPKLTRDNALILSSGANLNVPLLREIYTRIANGITLVALVSSGSTPSLLEERLRDDPVFRNQLLDVLRDADIGITNLRVDAPPEPSAEELERIRLLLVSQHGDRAREMAAMFAKQGKQRAILSEHVRVDGSPVEFGWAEESQGTQLFAQLFFLLSRALHDGSTVMADEFATQIHPLLAKKLLELFQNPDNNPRGAQLIFTTHYSQLMTPELFRKDQIWITDKTPQGQTELFSLADFRGEKYTRSSEMFEKNYLEGRYRGIGNFGPTLSGVPIGVAAAEEGKSGATK